MPLAHVFAPLSRFPFLAMSPKEESQNCIWSLNVKFPFDGCQQNTQQTKPRRKADQTRKEATMSEEARESGNQTAAVEDQGHQMQQAGATQTTSTAETGTETHEEGLSNTSAALQDVLAFVSVSVCLCLWLSVAV